MYPQPLTPREQEVAGLIAQGFGTARIAAILRCAPRSVEIYSESIYRKWEVANRVAVVRMVWREELRLDAAARGRRPARPARRGQWRDFYGYLMRSLANYGLASRQVRASTGRGSLRPRDAENNARRQNSRSASLISNRRKQ